MAQAKARSDGRHASDGSTAGAPRPITVGIRPAPIPKPDRTLAEAKAYPALRASRKKVFNMTILNSLMSVALMVAPAQAAAPEIGGVWEGSLSLGGQSIRIVFRIDPAGVVVMDSPDQGARGIPAERQAVEGGMVRLAVPSIRGHFDGRLSEDGHALTGALSQGGMVVPLVLNRTAETAAVAVPLARPQHPVAPLPYRSEEVSFDNPSASGVRLAGTLTLPPGDGPFPAAILITGSGPHDRDETLYGHKPFAVWADALTRRGIAVLRYDDRGVEGSTGAFNIATSADFASDAAAAFAWLAARADIDHRGIGLIGHSEGGLVAPLAVQQGVDADWVVMLAGPAVSGGDILVEQQRQQTMAAGAPPEAIAADVVIQRELMAIIARNSTDGDAALREGTAWLVEQGAPPAVAAQIVSQVSGPWFRWFITHDPAPALTSLDVPLLAVYGGRDVQVPAELNAPVLAQAQSNAEIVILPTLNHLFQPAVTGLPDEYGLIETTIDPSALAAVVDWVAAQSSRRNP